MDSVHTSRQWGECMNKVHVRYICTSILTFSLVACSDDKDGKKTDAPPQAQELLSPKVIYGDDNRLDLYQVQSLPLLQLADSTVALIAANDLHDLGGTTQIRTTPYANSYRLPLCPTERFRDQDVAAFCSGFLVAPNLIATAGHCIRTQGSATSDCETTRFVFGFGIHTTGERPQSVPSSEVYSCKRIVRQQLDDKGADFSLVELDRPVLNHAPLNVRREGVPTTSDTLVVIGHPSGLPTKVADSAKIRNVLPSYIQASLDTYGGNSGSAVFNSTTHQVEGILVRGEEDFVVQGSCMASKRCTQDGCRGEDVTRISEVLPYIPTPQPPEPQPTPTPPSSRSRFSSGAPLIRIPDNYAFGVNSDVKVNEVPRGRKVKVEVHITHPWRGDLTVSLKAPTEK